MPDHVHWVVALGNGESLSRLMQSFKGYVAYRLNQIEGLPEKIWQSGFHDHALRSDEDLRAMARYVIANPLRAGLVDDIGLYPRWDAIWL